MNKTKLILSILLLTMIIPLVSAVLPTQQYNKLYLSPFYQPSMSLNTNYTFTVTVNPPDRITAVNSAIIGFNGQINGQTQSFQIWVNGQTCNTNNYTVATAFSTTGNVQFSFDCSNRINKAGTYNITLRSSVNTGAMSGWLELTYMNKPAGNLALMGTEYSPGDPATIFLQLADDQGLPVTNGACYVDVWYPNSPNSTHPYTIIDAPMIKAAGDDGIYYYDITAPSLLGVYMVSAKCSYALSGAFIYSMGGLETNAPTRTVVQGTYSGSSIFLNDYEDWIYTSCSSTGGGTKYCEAYYDFNTSIHFANTSNFSNADLFYMGEASTKATSVFSYWNWTSGAWVTLPNTLTFSATATSQPLGIGDYVSNSIPTSGLINSSTKIIRIRMVTSFGSNFNLYDNWLNIQLKTYDGIITSINGGSEMHVTNIPGSSANQSAAAVWEYTPNRNLTYYPPQVDLTNYSLIQTVVWNATNRNLTYYNMTDTTNYSLIASTVWSYSARNLTYFPAQVDLTDYSLIQTMVWNATNRNLTYYPTQVDLTNYSLIAELVWNYTDRNLTYYPTQLDLTNYTLINSGVWSYATRNLTYYPAQTDLTDYGLIQTMTWNATDRNLTYYPVIDNDAVALAVWNYSTRTLTYYPAQVDLTNYSLINSGVWSYTDRNLTYYPAQQDLTNYSAIESGVWSYTDRNLTYYPTQSDLTNYTLINDGVWSYNNRTLTYYPTQTDMTNYTAISQGVWNYTTRDLTYYQVNNLSAADVWTYINRTLTYYEVNNISAVDVWAYNNRTLTYYPSQSDLTNYTAIWEYPDRNLTYYPPLQVNASEIAENTWNYTARYTHGVILN